MYQIDHELLKKIDILTLSQANQTWRGTMKAAPWKVQVDRERWTVKSWKETEGEGRQIRRAKLLKCVLEHVEIKIFDFDEIVSRPTTGVIGCQTAIDVCGNYIPDIWSDSGVVSVTLDASAVLSKEELEVLRESARMFDAGSMPKRTYQAWEELTGAWARDAEAAKLKDPGLDNGLIGQTTATLAWNKIVRVGLRSFINECQEHIDNYIAAEGTDINKVHLWKSAMITLEATIAYAHRYAVLARELAEKETAPEKKARLIKIAETCEYVPEHAPRTFYEALQTMQFLQSLQNA